MPIRSMAFPTVCEQTLRALARYPSRVAFSWPGGSITYAGATELIGRFQKVFMQLGLEPGARVAFLTANRADTWCAGVAAQSSRLAITGCIRLGSLDDQLFQIEDSEARILVIDADTFRDRGGDLATGASSLKNVFTLGPPVTASICWPRSITRARRRRVALPARRRRVAELYGGTTGKSKARCATIESMAASPTRSCPTSKFRITRAISRSRRSAMSPAPRCCRR